MCVPKAQFQIPGEFVAAEPYGAGHINDTYASTYNCQGRSVRYVHQRINRNIFHDPASLMENILRVTEHLRCKLEANGERDLNTRTLTLVPARDGRPYYRDGEGDFWRAYYFIEGGRTYEVVETTEQACESAGAFGRFQKMLIDLPGPPLVETLPGFHDGLKRFANFEQALEADRCNRARSAAGEIEFVQRHRPIVTVMSELEKKGGMPVRITHNDTKFNNVILDDQSGRGICVIDLDTVMPGLVLYDFGDMVRTTTSPAAEDERDLSKVTMQMPMFEALVRGYVEAAGDFLTRTEREELPFAGKFITFLLALRFLTDYLSGDIYYKTHREAHNLDRCRTQIKLIESMIEQEEAMDRVVKLL